MQSACHIPRVSPTSLVVFAFAVFVSDNGSYQPFPMCLWNNFCELFVPGPHSLLGLARRLVPGYPGTRVVNRLHRRRPDDGLPLLATVGHHDGPGTENSGRPAAATNLLSAITPQLHRRGGRDCKSWQFELLKSWGGVTHPIRIIIE